MLTRKMSSATPTDLLDVVWSRELLPSMSDCGTEGNPNFTKLCQDSILQRPKCKLNSLIY